MGAPIVRRQCRVLFLQRTNLRLKLLFLLKHVGIALVQLDGGLIRKGFIIHFLTGLVVTWRLEAQVLHQLQHHFHGGICYLHCFRRLVNAFGHLVGLLARAKRALKGGGEECLRWLAG